MAGSFTNLPTALGPLLQTGFLERELSEGLDSVLAFRKTALIEKVPAGIGETITKSRTGRFPVSTVALNPTSITPLDDGVGTVSAYSVEQYTLTLQNWAGSYDVNWVQSLATVGDLLIKGSRNLGVQAAQTLERLAQQAYYTAYMGGNTRVRTDLAASTTTTCRVDDIRGFQNVLVNGVVTPVSGTNTLTVYETGAVTQTLTVTGVAADVTNLSSAPGGISGTLTFTTATAPGSQTISGAAVGDALQAINAPFVARPGARSSTGTLQNGDVLTVQLILDAVAQLRVNGVPPFEDGNYLVILDPISQRQLMADQDFKIWYQGRSDSDVFNSGYVLGMLGCTFISSTEVPYQPIAGTGSLGVGSLATGCQTGVRRPLVIGAEALIQGSFAGLDSYVANQAVGYIGNVMQVNDVIQVIRPPLDRLQQTISLAWTWIGGFVCPTDATATNLIIPTANNANYKRAVVIEHAG